MRILHVVHQYPPEYIGGVELNTQWVAHRQVQLGHEVSIFYRSNRKGAGIERWHEENGVEVWAAYNGKVNPTQRFLATFRDSLLSQHFQQALVAIQPQVVHIQHLMGLPVTLVQLLQQQALPYVITLHDYWWICANAQLLTNDTEEVCDGPRRWINCGRCALARAGQTNLLALAPALAPLFASRHFLLRRFMQGAARLIVPTAFTKEIYVKSGMIRAEQVQIVPNGINPIHHNRGMMRNRETQTDLLQIAYVGGIAHQKGVHILIQAVSELPVEKVQLTIYGDVKAFPEYVTELHQLASSNVTFMGRMPNEQVLKQLTHADILVVPSIWYEIAGLVVQEAFSVGVPVIASDIGALSDRIRHGTDGFHFPAGDWRALRDILLQLIDDRSLLIALRKNLEMNDTIENQVELIESIYRDFRIK